MINSGKYKRLTPEVLAKIEKMKKGRLKIYIGAAPGVGKTYTMLQDANELLKKGVDIVVGVVEFHGRKETEEQLGDLEVIPLKNIEYKGRVFQELDVGAIIERNPDVVIIDELAHTNVPGSKNKKRYEDVQEILKAGIHVWTAMNIQHLESISDIVKQITGVQVNERVPDTILKEADEVEIVDVSPETLQDRMREGKIYSPDKVQQALTHFFQKRNLVALRELVLREVADHIDEQLEKERSEQGIEEPAGIQERILVCVNYRPNAEKLIRRGSRIAQRLNAEWFILHIAATKKLSENEEKILKEWQELARQLNAQFILKKASPRKVGQTIVDVCREYKITQILMGQSARTRWEEIIKGSIVNFIMRKLEYVDVHIVSSRV